MQDYSLSICDTQETFNIPLLCLLCPYVRIAIEPAGGKRDIGELNWQNRRRLALKSSLELCMAVDVVCIYSSYIILLRPGKRAIHDLLKNLLRKARALTA